MSSFTSAVITSVIAGGILLYMSDSFHIGQSTTRRITLDSTLGSWVRKENNKTTKSKVFNKPTREPASGLSIPPRKSLVPMNWNLDLGTLLVADYNNSKILN